MQKAAQTANTLSIAVQDAADKAKTLSAALGSDLSGPANTAMSGYNDALQSGVDRALAIAKAGAEALKSALSFSAAPTIAPRLAPTGATQAPAGSKRSAMRAGGNISIAQANFHGVKDVAGMKRQLMAQADRNARGARAGALHDVDSA
ncbi:MAG: hypothetical protein HZY79_15480 [Rhodoblastus sp.]|nr:MAG: hypothetical protein HZY79_15480 [Rhodoblastus sp.]